MDRAWEAIHELTRTVQELVSENVELKADLKAFIQRVDDMVTNGTTRCADHNARIVRLEDNREMIDRGTHPACVAQYRGIKLWVYSAAVASLMSFLAAGASLVKILDAF